MSSRTPTWLLEDVLHYLKLLSCWKKKSPDVFGTSWRYKFMNVSRQIDAVTDICSYHRKLTHTHTSVKLYILAFTRHHRRRSARRLLHAQCACQSSSQLHQVSVIFLADRPSQRAAGVNAGPPAALQHELLTPTIIHLASIQPSFSIPAFTFLSLFTTPAFMDSSRSITQRTPCTLALLCASPPSLFRLLSNYSWYLAWVTVFNNVFENKRALLKGGGGGGAAKRAAFRGRAGDSYDGHSFAGRKWLRGHGCVAG